MGMCISCLVMFKLICFISSYCMHDVLNPCQHGFVKCKSCFTNLLESHNTWTGALDMGLVFMFSYILGLFQSV